MIDEQESIVSLMIKAGMAAIETDTAALVHEGESIHVDLHKDLMSLDALAEAVMRSEPDVLPYVAIFARAAVNSLARLTRFPWHPHVLVLMRTESDAWSAVLEAVEGDQSA